MKRCTALLLVCVMLLAVLFGCAKETGIEATPTPTATSVATPTVIPEPTPEPTPENPTIAMGAFTFSYSDLYDRVNGENASPITFFYEYENYCVKWCMPTISYIIAAYSEVGHDEVAIVEFLILGDTKSMTAAIDNAFDAILAEADFSDAQIEDVRADLEMNAVPRNQVLTSTQHGACITLLWDEEYLRVRVYPEDPAIDPNDLPIEPSKQPDFLSDKDRLDEIKKALKAFDYAYIVNLAEAYLQENESVREDDNVHNILEKAKELLNVAKQCTVEHDSFSDTYTLYYKGIKNVSNSIAIVPSVVGTSMSVRLGFKKSGWVFFKQIEIKTDDEKNIMRWYNYFDVTRDVGGGITEYVDDTLSDVEYTAIVSASAPQMRFIGDDDKYFDHMITDAEINALIAVKTISDSNQELTKLTNAWNNYGFKGGTPVSTPESTDGD